MVTRKGSMNELKHNAFLKLSKTLFTDRVGNSAQRFPETQCLASTVALETQCLTPHGSFDRSRWKLSKMLFTKAF
ncbi:hypothetical protein [Leptospira kirschneri]|uniref:hypothetical protein n=1 Tax=Leptospira kirschneri TaxID=29507 RepID=UPI00034D4F78|nr:hypothetical protein [Leptospira kirschneri]